MASQLPRTPPAARRSLTWDEGTIAEHDKLRGTRQKIEEVETPSRRPRGKKTCFRSFLSWRRVAASPRLRRGNSVETTRGDAAAATWIFRGRDEYVRGTPKGRRRSPGPRRRGDGAPKGRRGPHRGGDAPKGGARGAAARRRRRRLDSAAAATRRRARRFARYEEGVELIEGEDPDDFAPFPAVVVPRSMRGDMPDELKPARATALEDRLDEFASKLAAAAAQQATQNPDDQLEWVADMEAAERKSAAFRAKRGSHYNMRGVLGRTLAEDLDDDDEGIWADDAAIDAPPPPPPAAVPGPDR